jgi:hypothetical protein
MREAIEEAFWSFVDQKWKDALNVAAAELVGWGAGGGRGATHEADKRGPAEAARKLVQAAIQVAAVDGKPQQQGAVGDAYLRKYWDVQAGTRPGIAGPRKGRK